MAVAMRGGKDARSDATRPTQTAAFPTNESPRTPGIPVQARLAGFVEGWAWLVRTPSGGSRPAEPPGVCGTPCQPMIHRSAKRYWTAPLTRAGTEGCDRHHLLNGTPFQPMAQTHWRKSWKFFAPKVGRRCSATGSTAFP